MTPRQLQTHFDAAMRRLDREQRGRAWLAWHTAACYRAEKLPRIEDLWSDRPSAPVVQPLDEMRNNAMMFTQLMGGTIERRGSPDA